MFQTKAEEYNNALQEFSRNFKSKILELNSTTLPDDPAKKLSVKQLYKDLNDFTNNNSGFYRSVSTSVYTSRTYVDICIRDVNLKNGCSIRFSLERGTPRYVKEISFFGFYQDITINIENRLNFVYRFLDFWVQHKENYKQLDKLLKEAIKEEWEMNKRKEQEVMKQKRIQELSMNSCETWLKELMKESEYPYRIEKEQKKLLLKVRVTKKQQIEIPVYYKSFQKIIPQIMETIKQSEEFLTQNKIKVLIGNASPDSSKWVRN